MNTNFVVASEYEISKMKSFDDVLLHIERTMPMIVVGGMSLEAITSLSKVFLSGESKEPDQTKYSLKDGSRFYK